MKQLIISLILGAAIAGGSLSPAVSGPAPNPFESAVERLEAEGYTVVESYRSWLGRLVVISTRAGVLREVVLNRTTGAVLSDRLFDTPAAQSRPQAQTGAGAGTDNHETVGGADHAADGNEAAASGGRK